MSEKRCPYCARDYEPYARAVERQKHCGLSECRRKHKRARDRVWRSKDAEWRQARQVKVGEWARERQYWQSWRSKHPEYRSREALRMRRKRQGGRRKTGGIAERSAGISGADSLRAEAPRGRKTGRIGAPARRGAGVSDRARARRKTGRR
jgi:hypothetical protein